MKLDRKKLRKMILKEIKNLSESQKAVGLPHNYTYEDLYQRAFGLLKQHPDLRKAPPDIQAIGEQLLKMLHNAVQQSVTYRDRNLYDDDYNVIEPYTTEEDTARMKEMQGRLRMMRNALASSLPGHRHDYSGRSSYFSEMLRAADPTGEKQKSGLRPDQISDAYHDAIGRRYDDDY